MFELQIRVSQQLSTKNAYHVSS